MSKLTDALRKRAKQDQDCADNSAVVADALAEQMRRFKAREEQGWNTYAVRMAVDHQNSVKRDGQFAEELRSAADLLDEAEKALAALGFGDLSTEDIGWRGEYPAPSTESHFRCEFCKAEHTDCTEIPHAETCPVVTCRATLARIRGEKT